MTFVVTPLSGYIAWKWGVSSPLAALVSIVAFLVWGFLWSRFFTSDGHPSTDSDMGFDSEDVE